jgi:hypothetical protein
MLNNAAQTGNLAVPADALYNFKLLSALRADDPQAVQPFLDQLGSSNDASRDVKAGLLLAMAVRIASGQSTLSSSATPAHRQHRSFSIYYNRLLSRIPMYR